MKKIDIFTIAALTVTLLPVSCQMEEPAEELTYTVNVPIVFGDNPTTEEAEAIIEVKADVDGTSGVTTWTTGDQIAYYVSGAGANKYQVKTINGTIVPVSLTSSQSRVDFAVYPPASANATYHTSANLKVKYPTTYDFSGMTALQMATFSPLPMVGDNTQPNIVLYNVGGLLRLTVNNVPAAAKYIKVTVPGMNITGDYTVSTPASSTPSVTATTGSNDNVTFQIAETTIGTQGNYTVNLPLPAGDYSGVTGNTITVEALDGSSSSIAAANGAITHWTTLGRRKGKKLTVDFAPANFAINEGTTTIWKSQTANFTTNATAGSVTWESETPGVATFDDPTDGEVRGVAAGTTRIRAKLNGVRYSDWVTVNVNEVTVLTLASDGDKSTIGVGETLDMTATITHTTYGAITDYPTISWSSSQEDKITVPASSTPVYATSSTATTTVAITGVSVGSSSITASINSDFEKSKDISCAIEGFQVSTTTYVKFAPGNLQATTTDNGVHWTWGFAPDQLTFVFNSDANQYIDGDRTVSTNGTVDLFGWSTSSTYYGIHNSQDNATYSGEFVDWGVVLGEYQGHTWRTLTNDEHWYLYNTRATGVTVNDTANARYTEGYIDVNNDGDFDSGTDYGGVILFPNNYDGTTPDGVTWGKINNSSNWGTRCTTAGWAALESKGCVFLPAAGRRNGTQVSNQDIGYYWSSTKGSSDPTNNAFSVYYGSGWFAANYEFYGSRFYGRSVRLVRVLVE